jgi:hypothetical protein
MPTGIELSSGVLVGSPKSLDAKYGPYDTVALALADILAGLRHQGLTVGIKSGGSVVEYWFKDGVADADFVEKVVAANWDTLLNKPSTFPPSSHANTHHTSGTDAIAPDNIGAAWQQTTSVIEVLSDTTLAAGRNRRITVLGSLPWAVNLTLPVSDNQILDRITIQAASVFINGNVTTIRANEGTNESVGFVTLATLTSAGQSFSFSYEAGAGGRWVLVPVDTHTHATSGINNDAVTNAKLADVSTSTIKGRISTGTGDPEDLTAGQVRTILNVADGAEANVNADWNASSGDAQILNKPTLGSAASANTTDFAAASHTHDATAISDSTTAGRALLTANDAQAQREAIDIFAVFATVGSFPATGQIERAYIANDTGKVYAWSGSLYRELSPNQHQRSGEGNRFVDDALYDVSLSGTNNTAFGKDALRVNAGGSSNVGLGTFALFHNTTGMNNVAVGVGALVNNIGGFNNTAVGLNTLLSLNGLQNCAGLGQGAEVTASNQVQLGNSATTTYAYGAVQNRSDARDKTDIRDTTLGLDFINSLRPVDFKWDMREDYRTPPPTLPAPDASEEELAAYAEAQAAWSESVKLANIQHDGTHKRNRYHHGLIAQEVKAAMESANADFGGYQDHSIHGGDEVLSIGYAELIAPLIKAVQELTAEVESLKAQISLEAVTQVAGAQLQQ